MPIQDVQTNKQHAVPQNFMSVEFKLIGDLTMRQFVYLLVFGGLAYLAFYTVAGLFKWPLVVLFIIIGVTLAWIKIQDRGMDEWLVNYFRAVYAPSQMVWRKEPMDLPMFSQQGIEVVKQELITLAPTLSRRKLEEFLKVQEDAGPVDKLDIPEKEYIMKVIQAFSQTTVDVEPEVFIPPVIEKVQQTEDIVEKKPLLVETPVLEKPKQIKTTIPKKAEKHISYNTVFNITPDMHSGRRFISLLPAQGQITLPIRGEKVILTNEEIDIEQDIKDKAGQLQSLLEQIKSEAGIPQVLETSVEVPAERIISESAKLTAEKIHQEEAKISEEINKLTEELRVPEPSTNVDKGKILEDLKKKQQDASNNYAVIQRQILELQKSLEEKKEVAPVDISLSTPAKPMVEAKIVSLTDRPNVLSGVVLDNFQNVIEGAIVLIRNQRHEPVVALKTNSVGEFLISSPLANGVYTVEVGNTDSIFDFDKVSVEVKGEKIPPLLISGKVK